MPREDIKAPPKEKPWFRCSEEGCTNLFQGYHGKVGCQCHVCDNRTPETWKDRRPTTDFEVMNAEE